MSEKIYLNQRFLFENRCFLGTELYERVFEQSGLKLIGEDLINNEDVLVFEIIDKKKASLFILKNHKSIVYE